MRRYKNGEGGTTIAKDFPVTHNAIYGLLDRRDVERRSVSETLSADWSDVETNYCDHCGEKIPRKYNPKRYLEREYCSPKCQADARVKERCTKTCPQCNGQFDTLRENAKYCSDECADKAGVTSGVVECGNCGKEYTEYRHKIERDTACFCCEDCYRKWSRGSNSPHWKGGRNGYRGPNWDKQREKAIFRYGDQCAVCGDKSKPQVHHMIPYREFESHEEANAIGNLIVLCPSHHIEADRHYDKHNEILYDHH